MTKVRKATKVDLPFLMEKAQQFNDQYYDLPMSNSGMEAYILYTIETGILLVAPSGMIAGHLHKDPRWDWTVLVETGWYSDGRDGVRLLKEFEKQGRLHGADEVRMTTLAVNSGVDKLLARKGYSPIETSHRLLL